MASSRWPFWPFGASASSSPADFLLLSRKNLERIRVLIRREVPLNRHQCLSLSSKLEETVKNIESLTSSSEDVSSFCGCVALENFYRVSEKAKILVENCCSVNWSHWCQASAFQIQNEEAFREILLEASFSYSTIYGLLEDINKENFCLDLRGSPTFDPPSAEEIRKDRVALKDRLKGLVNAANNSSSDIRFQCLGKYLLGRVKVALKQSIDKDFDVRFPNLSLHGEDLDGGWSEKSERLGSGVIKTALHGIPCAKKEFEDRLPEDEWLREAKILASLNHPNIVKFLCCDKYETVHTSGHYIAMEQMETNLGNFIRKLKKKGGTLPLFLALDIILQIGYGMCYLHDNGIAHRDLKAPNVVCSYNPPFLEVKVVDFGLAKINLTEDRSNTMTRPKIGTTIYMAPEAFSKGRVNWFKADVYSFSVMCSMILSGEEPFQGIGRSDLRAAICSGQRPELPEDTPKELASLIKEGWATDRNLRPSFLDICARVERLRDRLLRNHSLSSLGLRSKVEDQCDEEYPDRWSIESTIKNRSELRRSPQRATNLTTEECSDGDELEEKQHSVRAQQQLLPGLAFQDEIAIGMGVGEDGRGGIEGSSSCSGLQVSPWGCSSSVGVGGVDPPQSVGSALHLSSTSPLWSSPTDRGTVKWFSISPPLITSHLLIQGQAIPRQFSADVPLNSGLPRISATQLQTKEEPSSSLQHYPPPLQVATFVRANRNESTATHPSSSGANQSCPKPSLMSRNSLVIDYPDVDYWKEASSSINLVQELLSRRRVQLHLRQCQYLSTKMIDTGNFLEAKSKSLIGFTSGDDIRRKALRQLHFTVKCAEMLVRGCCCEEEPSWLESAVTLTQIKEDVVHILLDLRWWTSMVDIAIASVTWMTSGGKIEQELLDVAEKDFQKLLDEAQSPDNELDEAFFEDEKQLLRRVREVQRSYSGKPRDFDYLLATHVQMRLENTDLIQSMANVELNEYDVRGFVGQGSFGSVMEVQWLRRSCALKVLRCKCANEAMTLSTFQHPHIVQFFRYWETTFGSCVGSSSDSSDAALTDPDFFIKSHILMELLPTDLDKHLRMSKLRVGSKSNLSTCEGPPMSQDVGIDVMLQVTKAMWYLNNNNVAHRDLKPSNVLLKPVSHQEFPELAACGYVHVKLGDFGVANTMAGSVQSTSLSKNMGTRLYGAPEIFNKNSLFSKESSKFPRLTDVWSFGILFSEVLSGQPPFLGVRRHDLSEFYTRIQKGVRPHLPANCPDYLKFCIENCWNLRPQDRPSFAELWKLMRFAQVRSLGIIRENHDLFTFTTVEGVVKRLHKPKLSAPDNYPKINFFSLKALLIKFARRPYHNQTIL